MKERDNKCLKKLDLWIGSPLLFFLGAFQRKRSKPVLERMAHCRFALVKTAAIGDTILLSAMIDELKAAFPNSHLTVICSNNNAGMVRTFADVDEMILFQMSRPFHSLAEIHRLNPFDVVFDFGPWPRINGVISWMAKSAFRVGFRRPDMHRHYVYDSKVIHSDELHEIENYRNILRGAGVPVSAFLPDLRTMKHVRVGENYVVFHLYPGGAMEQQRKWNDARWEELGERVFQKYGYTILISGGPADYSAAEQMKGRLERRNIKVENIAGKYSLEQIASILQYAEIVISVNTGIMHYAAAVGVPLVALHGATSVKRWGPLGDCARVVLSGESCQPCISLGFESKCREPICMQHITVDMVMDQVDALLKTRTSQRNSLL